MFTEVQIDEKKLNRKLQKKLIWILVLTGCVANMIGFVSNALMFGMTVPTIVCGVCELTVICCGVAGIGFGRQKSVTVGMLLVLVLIEFPFLFYVYGANMGVYLILGIAALAIYFPRPYHVPAIIVTVLLDLVVIILSVVYPSKLEVLTRESMLGTMICSYAIVAAALTVILCSLINQYRLQRDYIITASQKLEYAAKHDPLTGVYNRRYLIDTLKQWMGMDRKHFLVVLLDIDDFKKINDTYGHVYGDEVLEELARIMKEKMEGKGIAARYGGEEFMLLFEEADRTAAMEIMDQMKAELREYSMRTRQIAITFSAGVEEYRTEARIDVLFHNADQKLYQAKNSGKDQIIF